MSDNIIMNFGCELQELSFKSCFARSELAHFKQTKSVDANTTTNNAKSGETDRDFFLKTNVSNKFSIPETAEAIKFRKNSRNNADETRRYSCSNINNTRRSCCSKRLAEIPVENRANQSKIETLLWQLKETQKSREMYRAVMKQVVTYLEKAHQSLEILGNKMNKKQLNHYLLKPEHLVKLDNSTGFCDTSTPTKAHHETTDDFASFKDFSWKHTKSEVSPDEIPPDKLASEAFRLLRTAQSLLNTCEPDLAHLPPQAKDLRIQSDSQPMTDVDFLAQIAKEFPPSNEYSNHINQTTLEYRPQRATSFSLSPKVHSIEAGVKMAFNRKLSLQLSEMRRSSKTYRISDLGQESVAECDLEILNIKGHSKPKNKTEKSSSSGNGSVSSVEDESGFSSMNSFQDVGLPLVNSALTDDVATRNALLRSMLHESANHKLNISQEHNISDSTLISNSMCQKKETVPLTLTDDVKVWQTPSIIPQHKRWYSTPVEDQVDKNQNLKVLWV